MVRGIFLFGFDVLNSRFRVLTVSLRNFVRLFIFFPAEFPVKRVCLDFGGIGRNGIFIDDLFKTLESPVGVAEFLLAKAKKAA